MLEDAPAEVFRSDSALRSEVVFRWPFATRKDLEGWTLRHLKEISWAAGGWLEFRSGASPALFQRKVDINAGRVDALEIDVLDFRHGVMELWWAAPGKKFSDRRRQRLRVGKTVIRPGTENRTTHTFHLRSEPKWRGTVGKVRLMPGARRNRTMGLREVRGVRFSPEPEALAAAVSRGWQVELGAELRNARLAPPGMPIEWPVRLERGSVLRFAYGLDANVPEPVRFSISPVREGRRGEPLFETALRPRAGKPTRWHQASVDLAAAGRGAVTLVFETEAVDGPFDDLRGFPVWGHPEILVPAREPGPANVILVSIDTLRADRLSLYGHPRDTSPGLAAWAESSAVVFENAVAPAPWTLPSHTSMLTGLSALHHGVNYAHQSVRQDLTLLAEPLRRAGFATLAMVGGGYLSPMFGFSQGFDVYRHWPDRTVDRELERGVSRAVAWLDQHRSAPFFLFLHTYEVHKPLTPRQPFLDAFGGLPEGWPERDLRTVSEQLEEHGFRTRNRWVIRHPETRVPGPLSESDLAVVSRLYDAGVAYADDQLNRLWRALEETGLDHNTVVVVTSDHGEALGEKGLTGHVYPYDFNLMVPLIVALPGREHAGRRVEQQVSLVDLVPTILELVGLPVPDGLDGSSLLPLIAGEAPAVERQAWSYAGSSNHGVALRVSNRLKYILNDSIHPSAGGREELYRLVEDPAEEHELAADAPELPHLRRRVRELLVREYRGLAFEFTNGTAETFEGSLAGDLTVDSLKSPDLCDRCLRRRDREVLISLPPGESFSLFFQGSRSAPVHLTGALGRGEELRLRFDPAVPTEPWQRVWDGSGWHRTSVPTERAMRIAARWQGDASAPASPLEPDPQLLEQLKALGYID